VDKLYPYQQRVFDAVVRGRSVIIQAPTGAGKTRAALYPFFANLERAEHITDAERARLPLPQTCRYAVPMRVLATQFEREYREHFTRLDQRRGTRFNDTYSKLGINLPAIQTGENPDDTLFESPLTFCTIDQLLASFIGAPYSVSPRLANMNVGAVVGSYLILDEFHLYPVEKGNGARLTSLAMLRMLRRFSPFVLMTATLSTNFLTALATLLDAEVIQVNSEELLTIQADRARTLFSSSAPMAADAILERHSAAYARGAGASLVVCNTVARAQAMYQELRQAISSMSGVPMPQLMLLHSRFTPEDRRAKSEQLEAWLGKETWSGGENPNVIVVATQVVEVGLNISAAVLHTELAPANALIQRFGRCARFAQQHGDVIVYPIPADGNGIVSHRPYDEPLCIASWEYLEQLLPDASSGVAFGFPEEQKLIDAVHTAEDQRMLEEYSATEGQLCQTIVETLATHTPGKRSQLIRDVESVSVLIHDDPEHVITTQPFIWTAFSLQRRTLQGVWDALRQRQAQTDAPWVMKELVLSGEQETGAEDDSRRETLYTWDLIRERSQIQSALLIALPPELATYDNDLGFRLLLDADQETTKWISTPSNALKKQTFAKREQRSYVEHISGLMRAYDWSVRRETAWLGTRLQADLALPDDGLDKAIRFAIAFHDLGKLCVGWQRWAHSYQQLLAAQHGMRFTVPPARQFLAKTDMLPSWQQEKAIRAQMTPKKPPTHAVSGAIATPQMLYQYLLAAYGTDTLTEPQQIGGRALMRATLSAIARHHSPSATTYDVLDWEPGVIDPLNAALVVCRVGADVTLLDCKARTSGEIDDDLLTLPERDGEIATWLAFALVRALRLCDQRAEREL
jgi:CRISPR-associated endonuclease/helicase Cas3